MPKKVLVVEDDPAASRFVGYTLEQEGYEVVIATNGLEGVMKAKQEEPDILVLDGMLPGLDGFQVCRRLRSETSTASLPILMLSAKAQEADKAAGFKVGADDYLAKPVDPSELVERVKSLLNRQEDTKQD